MRLLDRSGNQHSLKVRFLDTCALAPESASLDALGLLLGYKKVALPAGYEKSDMGRFKNERPDAFEEYLLRDAEITATA